MCENVLLCSFCGVVGLKFSMNGLIALIYMEKQLDEFTVVETLY